MKPHTGLYHSLVIFPDRVYPFKTEIGGQWVRGIRSYNATLARYQRKYGPGRYGFKLNFYRQLFHLVGIAAVLLISFQEFYLHRRMYQQLWRKGIIDWLAWCIPIGLYLFFIAR